MTVSPTMWADPVATWSDATAPWASSVFIDDDYYDSLVVGAEPLPPTFEPTIEWSPTTAPGAAPTWVDISSYVSSGKITKGRATEFDRTSAGTLNLKLNNTDRTFDPQFNSHAQPNKRIRVTTSVGSSYMSCSGGVNSGAWTTPKASLAITGDIDLRCRVAMNDWTPAAQQVFISKSIWSMASEGSYVFGVNANGTLFLGWTPNGTSASLILKNSTVAVGAVNGQPRWCRATLDVVNGGNYLVKFYTSTASTSDHTQVTWTQLGSTVTTVGSTSIYASSSVLVVGAQVENYNNMAGKFYAAAVLNGIGGNTVANPRFTGFAAGGTSGVDAQGNVWAIAPGASLPGAGANTVYHFDGFIDSLPQTYDPPNVAWVQLSATDGFKRLARAGFDPIYESVVSADAPWGWWRLGDDVPKTTVLADSSGHELTGRYKGAPAKSPDPLIQGSDLSSVRFEGDDDIGIVPSANLVTAPCSLEAWIRSGMVGTNPASIVGQVHVVGDTFVGDLHLFVDKETGVVTFASLLGGLNKEATGGATVLDGELHHLVGTIGTGRYLTLYVDGAAVATSSASSSSTLNGGGNIRIGGPPVGAEPGQGSAFQPFKGDLGEVALYDYALTASQVLEHYNAGFAPWSGDDTGDRVSRVLDLIGWPSADRSIEAGISTLGAAPDGITNGTALDHLQAVEKTEQGRFFIDGAGIATFYSRHHEVTLLTEAEFTDDQIIDLAFDFDDTNLCNDMTVTREGGLPQRAQTAAVIAGTEWRYSDNESGLLYTNDNEAMGFAEWRVENYSTPTLRPSGLVFKPMRDTSDLYHGVLDRELGDRVQVTRTLPGTDVVVDAVIEGITHTFEVGNRWDVEWNLSPLLSGEFGSGGGGGNKYLKLNDSVLGMLDTDNRLGF